MFRQMLARSRQRASRLWSSFAGLTLIEILVVIGICGVLAMMLVPFLLASREKGRTVVCANNLRSLGVAFTAVMPTRDGYFTNCYYDVSSLRPGEWWIGLRDEWDKNDPLVQEHTAPSFLCPSARGYVNVVNIQRMGEVVHVPTSYAYNVEMPIIAENFTRVPQPSTRVVLYDGDAASVVGTWNHTLSWPTETIVRRHQGQANFLFLDGHVETRGDFRAEPLHVCDWGQLVPEAPAGATPVEDAWESRGASDWVLTASVNLLPVSNNLKNQGNAVQCTIRLFDPEGCGVDTSTIYMLGLANKAFKHPLPAVPPISTSSDEGMLVCQVKFDRQLLYDEVTSGDYYGDEVPVKIVGEMNDGRPWEGVDRNAYFEPPR